MWFRRRTHTDFQTLLYAGQFSGFHTELKIRCAVMEVKKRGGRRSKDKKLKLPSSPPSLHPTTDVLRCAMEAPGVQTGMTLSPTGN